ncbi:MAG: divIVA [Gemmatimonadetes bacterium]|jgi:DivIVA domain-containing protein|nr:divIVA [Gemmatimonadota bacterium]
MDETFHLTPLDVRRYDFGKAMRGYNPERVEQFREQVADELERLTRQLQELDAKAKGFHEQLRAFRERDKALNDALVSAQQLRAEIRESSEREAQLIVREARAEGERLLEQTRTELRSLEGHLEELERARRTHLAQLRLMAERQLAEVAAAEHMYGVPAAALPPRAAAAPAATSLPASDASSTMARPVAKKAQG